MYRDIPVSFILDDLCAVVDVARASVTDARWLTAINAGWDWLLQQDAVSWDDVAHALTVESATAPGTFYTANGECQCTAFLAHKACWHRAAARLVRRALERCGERVLEAAEAVAHGPYRDGKTAQAEMDELYPPRTNAAEDRYNRGGW